MREQTILSPLLLDQTIETISRTASPDWLPWYPSSARPTILDTLGDTMQDVPMLEPLALAALRNECLIIMQRYATDMSPTQFANLSGVVDSLPSLSSDIPEVPLFDDQELFLLGHDTSGLFYALKDRAYRDYRESIRLFEQLSRRLRMFDQLRYRYSETRLDLFPTELSHAYARLMREYATYSVLPAIQEMLQLNLPTESYVLYELRSGYRELLKLDPTTFATFLPIRTTIEQFVQKQKFQDKNTRKPVQVQFTDDCADPLVYIDPGDLYRMTRNLLRDAVTHGDGPIIIPIIDIKENGSFVWYSIYSPGHLSEAILAIIGKQPYTTQDRGETLHGYGKVGARKLLKALWETLGASPVAIESLFVHHWTNIFIGDNPFVRWSAPLPTR